MKYVLLNEDGVVIEVRKAKLPGYVEAPDNVVCGMVWHGGMNYRAPKVTKEPRRHGTRYEVRKLFSAGELAWFYTEAETNKAVSNWLREIEWVSDFWLDHPTFKPMLALAVSGGGLAQDRMDEVLSTDFDKAGG